MGTPPIVGVLSLGRAVPGALEEVASSVPRAGPTRPVSGINNHKAFSIIATYWADPEERKRATLQPVPFTILLISPFETRR